MIGIPSIYKYIGGAVLALILIGSLYGLIANRNHWKSVATDRQEQVNILKARINDMTTKQNTQTTTTQKAVERVVLGPERVKTVVKTIHDAPEPANCATPPLPEDVNL